MDPFCLHGTVSERYGSIWDHLNVVPDSRFDPYIRSVHPIRTGSIGSRVHQAYPLTISYRFQTDPIPSKRYLRVGTDILHPNSI